MSIDAVSEGPRPPEHSRGTEGEQKAPINQVSARVILGAVDPKYYDPTRRGAKREDLEALKITTPDSIQYQPVNAVLTDSCIAYYHDDERDLADIVQAWNKDFAHHIKEMTSDSVDPDLRERRIVAFKSLGITVDTIDDAQVDIFRRTYLAHNADDGSLVEAKLGNFIQDVGNDFEAIQDILTIFGAEEKDKILVKSYIQAHGFLSQTEETKNNETATLNDQLRENLSEAQRNGLQALHAKQQATTQQFTSQRQPPSRPPGTEGTTRPAGRPTSLNRQPVHTPREQLHSWVGEAEHRPSIPDQHESTEKPFEDMSADEVADALLDYRTGEVTNMLHINLKESYERALQELKEHIQTNPESYGEGNVYVFSDVAYAMIDRIASESNLQQKDFPMMLFGKQIPHANGYVNFIGITSPIGAFSQANPEMIVNQDYYDYSEANTRLKQLLTSTGLDNTFTTEDSQDNSTLILHSRQLTPTREGEPYAFTEGDKALLGQLHNHVISVGGDSAATGVVTKVPDGSLAINIALTQRGEQDTVHHTEHLRWDYMPTLEEERDKVDPNLHKRFISTDGKGYTITKMHRGDTVEVVSDTGETITGDPLYDILSGSRWETIDEKRERIDASYPVIDDEPLDDHILDLASRYLNYNDDYYFTTPPWNYYAREFANMIEIYTESWLYTKAQENIAELTRRLQILNFPLTESSQNPSWYFLGVAAKRVLAAHENVKTTIPDADKYYNYDPLVQYMPGAAGESKRNSEQAEEDIVLAMLGGEIYKHNSLYHNVTLSTMDETDKEKALAILSEHPPDGQNTIALYKLQELGEIFTKHIPQG